MKISINVPSYKRAGMLKTIKILPNAVHWIHQGEVKVYKKAHPGIKIKVLPDSLKGNVAKVRNYILRETLEDHDASLQIDDDVKHLMFWENKKKIKLDSEDLLIPMIEKYTRLAQEFGVKLWGVNVKCDKQNYREYTPFSLLSYVSASFSCFLKGNEILYDERFPLKEDYDMTIQQLNRYRKVLRINKFCYEKLSVEQTGGCAGYRNVGREMAQIVKLQAKWGRRIVKVDEGVSRSHNTDKSRSHIDINPIIRVPIRGV